MNWKEYYKQHLMSAEDAVNHIQSGNRVVVAHACGEPSYLLDVMVANAKAYRDVEIVHMVAMGKAEYCKPEYAGNFRHNAFFVGGTSRDAIAEGRGDFTPSFFFEVPRQFSSTMPVDVAMVMVTPPDENGMCSLGVSVDYTLEAVKQAKLVIAQVNPQMPWTGPYSLVSVKDLDCIVEHEAPIIELKPPRSATLRRPSVSTAPPWCPTGPPSSWASAPSPTPCSSSSSTRRIWASTPRCSPTAWWSWPRPASSPTPKDPPPRQV